MRCPHPPLLHSHLTLGLPVTGKGEGWTAEAIAAFSAKRLPQRGPEMWVYSGGVLCMKPLCYTFFFSAVRVKKLSASDSLGCWALLVFIFLPSVICANCYFMHMEYTTSSLSSLVWSKSLAHVENNKQKLTCSLPSLMSITTSNYLEY